MDLHDLLSQFVEILDELGIAYYVTGGQASISYSEARFTNDIDVVADLRSQHIDAFCLRFPLPDYYISADAVREAVRIGQQFNIIHVPTGGKIDVMPVKADAYSRERMQRARMRTIGPRPVRVAAPEDIILMKLVFYAEGGSEKHTRDIASMIKVSGDGIDCTYIEHRAQLLGVAKHWSDMKTKLRLV